jgi:hypothetical protein
MRQLIIPWIATLLFGCVVFVVGKVLQASERRNREERKAAMERNKIIATALAQEQKQQEHAGIMAAAGTQGQRIGTRVH